MSTALELTFLTNRQLHTFSNVYLLLLRKIEILPWNDSTKIEAMKDDLKKIIDQAEQTINRS